MCTSTPTKGPTSRHLANTAAKQLMLKQRLTKCKSHTPKTKPIDVENHQPKQPQRTRRPWTNNLFVSDKHILLSPTAWLTDDIIGATQDLLKKEVPLGNGFQSTCCGITCAFDIESDEFIQIVHNGHGHWLTISTIGSKKGEVFVYDSMYPCVSDIVKRQIAALLATKEKEIKLKFVDVQKQSGGYDCGLFAIAFATSLVYGVQPGNVRYDQPKMRKHLCQCLEEERIRPFPALKTKRTPRADITTTDSIEVYCLV